MRPPVRFLTASQAAARLGISAKALRLYEENGLIAPGRTAAGWRSYGPADMARAAEIVSLRAFGLSLAQVARVLDGEPADLEEALAAHESKLQDQARQIARTLGEVRRLRAGLAKGRQPETDELAGLLKPRSSLSVAFDLPWPWGGEPFALDGIKPLNFIVGPLGSGKTRLAERLAGALPNAQFVGLDRLAENGATAKALLDADEALKSRVEQALAWIAGEGGHGSDALTALLVALHADGPDNLVVDMVEQDLDRATQEALIAGIRLRPLPKQSLFLMTRSTSILDLAAMGPDETIIFCPANHSPPFCVAPHEGAPGYEAVATCLAAPEVRARTAGVIAWRGGAQSQA